MSAAKENVWVYGPEARKIYMSPFAQLLLPAASALLVGFLFGFTAVSLAATFRWQYWKEIASAVFSLAMIGGYFETRHWVRQQVKEVDKHLYELAAQRGTGKPTFRVETVDPTGRIITNEDIPATPAQLAQVAQKLASGSTISQGNMLKVFNGSRDEFQDFQEALVLHQYAYWVNEEAHSAGLRLHEKGKLFFRSYLNAIDRYYGR